MCDCIKKVNASLAEHNGQLAFGFVINEAMGLKQRLLISTEKLDKAKRKPVPYVTASHCPFCGSRFDADVSQTQAPAPAPAVPMHRIGDVCSDEIAEMRPERAYREGWNACRAAMLTAAPTAPAQSGQTAAVAAVIGLNSALHRIKSGNSAGAVDVIEHVRTVLSSTLPSQPAVPGSADTPTAQDAEHAGLVSVNGHLSTLLNESIQMLAQLRAMVDALHDEWSNGGRPERGEFSLLDRVDDWLNARPSEMLEPQHATPAQPAAPGDVAQVIPLNQCAADGDGDCEHAQCPQLRDGEPHASGRHCPLDAAARDERELLDYLDQAIGDASDGCGQPVGNDDEEA